MSCRPISESWISFKSLGVSLLSSKSSATCKCLRCIPASVSQGTATVHAGYLSDDTGRPRMRFWMPIAERGHGWNETLDSTMHAKELSTRSLQSLQAQLTKHLCIFSLASSHALAPAGRWRMVGTTMSARCVAVLAAVLAVAHAGRARVGPSTKHCPNSCIRSCIRDNACLFTYSSYHLVG